MNNRAKKYTGTIIAIGIIISSFSFIFSASALTASCQQLREKIDKKIASLAAVKRADSLAIVNADNQIVSLVQLLESQNYNNLNLKNYSRAFHNRVIKFSSDVNLYQSQLNQLKEKSCGSETEYKTVLQGAKDKLKTSYEDLKIIKDFYNSAIRPELVRLKNNPPNIPKNSQTTISTQAKQQ